MIKRIKPNNRDNNNYASDYYHQMVNVGVASSRVAERLKTKDLRKLGSSLPSGNKTFVIAVKNYAEAFIKVFCTCPILFDFFIFFQILCPGLQTLSIIFFPRSKLKARLTCFQSLHSS